MDRAQQSHGSAVRKLVSMTVAVGLLVLAALIVRRGDLRNAPKDDDDQLDRCITQMLQAAQSGDVTQYLNCFTGALHDKLASRLDNVDRNQAAAMLRGEEAGLKSYVTMNWSRESADEATLVLEKIYAEANTRHRVRLRRTGRQWKLSEMTPLESYAPKIPYGTPVFQPPQNTAPETRNSTQLANPDGQ